MVSTPPMFTRFYRACLQEPWLRISRWLTYRSTARAVQARHSNAPAYTPRAGSRLYVAASTLPYHISGYTTRTQAVVSAMLAADINVHAVTRPGYPWDRRDRLCDAASAQTKVGNVLYHHSRSPANNRPVMQYARQAAAVIAKHAEHHRVDLIHAASNHVNALPALLAARRLGIPFHYEMRGIWELTRISRQPEFEGSQAYLQGLQLEALVARNADHVYVISEQLGRYVAQQWGVDPRRMSLLPNCVDPSLIQPDSSAQVKPYSLGYAGSLINYEGLDTLINAVHRLATSGHRVSLTIIGDGEARDDLETQVQGLGIGDRVRFLGKLPPDKAREELARCAVVCIPRRPFLVCQIVPPIKLVEALAMGKPVIVPDLPVFRDELGGNPAGWFFQSGNDGDLADVIWHALGNPHVLEQKSRQARHYAVTQRNWNDFVASMLGGVDTDATDKVELALSRSRNTDGDASSPKPQSSPSAETAAPMKERLM